MKIASYLNLDGDIYTVIKLTIVSKSFLSSFSPHFDPDMEWELRCKYMRSHKKSPGCKTWRETYFSIIRRRCAVCFTHTTAALGCLLPVGPQFLVVCGHCQRLPGPYEVVSSSEATRNWFIPRGALSLIPHKYRKVSYVFSVKDYLKSTIDSSFDRR